MEIVVLALAGLGMVLAAWSRSNRRGIDTKWSATARRMGLTFTPGTWRDSRIVSGRLHGHFVTVDSFVRQAGQSSSRHTRFRVRFAHPLGLGMRLRRRGFVHRIGAMLGASEIVTGDTPFDQAVHAEAADRAGLLDALTPERRQLLLRLFASGAEPIVDDDGIEVVVRGVVSDGARIERQLLGMVDVARALRGREASAPARREAAEADRATGRSPIPPTDPDPVDAAAIPDAGALVGLSSSLRDRLADVDPAAASAGPAPAAGSATPSPAADAVPTPVPPPATSRAPSPASTAAATPVPPPAQSSGSGAGPTAEEVCTGLFGPGVNSFDVPARFAERYRGARVRWSAPLSVVERSGFDVHLGGGLFVRATFTLCQHQGGLLGRREVVAVVRLPDEAHAELVRRRGEVVTFEGAVIACDPFARALYLTDASIGGASG